MEDIKEKTADERDKIIEEDIKILEELSKKTMVDILGYSRFVLRSEYRLPLENLLKRYKELEEENKKLKELDLSNSKSIVNMSQRHFNDSQKIKELDQAMTYMLQDLEVEKKGWTIEEMKRAYLSRAKSNGIFIK